MDVTARTEVIEELCSFEGRLAGTDAERRAANRLAERLRELGRRVEVEPTYVHPQYALVHAVHCALGVVGSLLAIAAPALGFGLVLATATSMYLDLNYRFYLLRRLFFRRASQNVVSQGTQPARPARVVLTAHLDAARTGFLFEEKRARRSARFAARHGWFGPFRLLFWSLVALLPLLGARMAGVDSELISLLQLPPTLLLLVAVFAAGRHRALGRRPRSERQRLRRGDRARRHGRATERKPEEPRRLGRPPRRRGVPAGGHALVRARHRKRLASTPTYFLNLDTVGNGDVRFNPRGGWAIAYPAEPAPGRARDGDRRGRRRGRRPLRREAARHRRRRRRDAASRLRLRLDRHRLHRRRRLRARLPPAERHPGRDRPRRPRRAHWASPSSWSASSTATSGAGSERLPRPGRTPRPRPTRFARMSAEKLWEPSAERIERAAMTRYMRWLERERGLAFGSYEELWEWSVERAGGLLGLDLGLLRRPGSGRTSRCSPSGRCPAHTGSRVPS